MGFFLVCMPPNQDRSFNSGLAWNGHLDLYGSLDFCGGLIHSLSGGSLEPLGLDNGGDRPNSSGGNSMRNVKKAGERVLHLCDFLIKVFDATF